MERDECIHCIVMDTSQRSMTTSLNGELRRAGDCSKRFTMTFRLWEGMLFDADGNPLFST